MGDLIPFILKKQNDLFSRQKKTNNQQTHKSPSALCNTIDTKIRFELLTRNYENQLNQLNYEAYLIDNCYNQTNLKLVTKNGNG